MEFENVKEVLEYLYGISQNRDMVIKTYERQNRENLIDERRASIKDMQEIIFEAVANIADLLGLEEIYLDD